MKIKVLTLTAAGVIALSGYSTLSSMAEINEGHVFSGMQEHGIYKPDAESSLSSQEFLERPKKVSTAIEQEDREEPLIKHKGDA